jgi:hypothetical protein
MPLLSAIRLAGVAATASALAGAATAATEMDWLSLCGKCMSATITAKSGIGAAHVVAEGRITRREAEGWCANWSPATNPQSCVRERLASEDAKKTYRATADSTKGRISAIN